VKAVKAHRTTEPTVAKENSRMTLLTKFVSGLNLRFAAGEAARDLAGQGRREEGVLCTRPTEDAEIRSVTGGHSAVRRVALLTALASSACLLAAGPAAAAPSPWWHLTQRLIPSHIVPGGEGKIDAQAIDLGDAPTSGPLTLSDDLPAGITVKKVEFFAPNTVFGSTTDLGPSGFLKILGVCQTTSSSASCTLPQSFFEGIGGEEPRARPLLPYEALEMQLTVEAEVGASSGAVNEIAATGGGAGTRTLKRPMAITAEGVAFGIEDFSLAPEEEGGGPATRAGSHPYQLTTDVNFNRSDPVEPFDQPALPRNLFVRLPAGQLGNATAVPRCSNLDFATVITGGAVNKCPGDTAIGVSLVTASVLPHSESLFVVPVFNLVPAVGEPARFGFEIAGNPVILDTSVRSGLGEDYGVDVDIRNITQVVGFLSATTVFWGAPGASSHDESRGWGCIAGGRYNIQSKESCTPAGLPKPPAFLTLPTNCVHAFNPLLEGQAWPTQGAPAGVSFPSREYQLQDESGNPLGLTACNQVPFEPTIAAEPTSDAATSPTGLGFGINFDDEGLTSSEGVAQSQLKKVVVSLPQGFTANPSVAEGLHACPLAAYQGSTLDGSVGCPENSKIGQVKIKSPLVEQEVEGSLFVAEQGKNPNGNLLTIYLVARNPEIGILVRQALKVTPDPVTGQLTTEVDDVPQLPFSSFHLEFRQGQRSPLITPPTCGNYTVHSTLSPWSDPLASVQRESSFAITQGPEGQSCPNGVPPFHPGLEAGTINNAAGTYSPFVTHITRKDSEQEITRFSIKLPTGLIAKLAGVSECSDAAIAQAKSREVEGGGAVEEAHPSCPANSEVGHSLVGTGVGDVLAYAGGKLYLAGPYHGSPISLVSITAAKVGPFDLGTVVVRFAIDVNHETAEVSVDGANSDPIPHIVDGIPIHLRDIRAYVSRSNFTLNPTSCAKKSTAATVLGSGANFVSSADDVPVTVSSPFQAADCASLGFAPKLALSLTGKKTHRGALPAFKAVLTYPKGGAYANIARAQVTLPPSEFLEQGHLKNVCTRKQFESGTVFGENCPKNSIYGKARAVTPLLDKPLEGPVYLRTGYGTKLPELAAALNGPQINIDLAGKIDSVHVKGTEGSRIRNTFAMVPDAPVEKFTLELKGGKKGLLVNSTDVCKGTHKALAAFTGQNGRLHEFEPALKAQCGKGGKKKSGAKKKNGKAKGGK
jgi:hypothetical protein